MDDLEQQCEDALFEVCDARERYPSQCANELEKCIKITNEIHTAKVVTKPMKILDVPSFTDEETELYRKNITEATKLLTMQEDKLQLMIDRIDNLKAVLDQVKRDKACKINRLLWD